MLTVCVGQAGNQIGGAVARRTGPLSRVELAETLGGPAERGPGGSGRISGESVGGRVKASGFVFVDSEPKVVRGIVSERGGEKERA